MPFSNQPPKILLDGGASNSLRIRFFKFLIHSPHLS
jgi:hypothetical protein